MSHLSHVSLSGDLIALVLITKQKLNNTIIQLTPWETNWPLLRKNAQKQMHKTKSKPTGPSSPVRTSHYEIWWSDYQFTCHFIVKVRIWSILVANLAWSCSSNMLWCMSIISVCILYRVFWLVILLWMCSSNIFWYISIISVCLTYFCMQRVSRVAVCVVKVWWKTVIIRIRTTMLYMRPMWHRPSIASCLRQRLVRLCVLNWLTVCVRH